MSKRKTLWIVLISIVAVLVLAAGGYALYRYGYARGASAEMTEVMREHCSGELEVFHMHEFDEHMMPLGRHTGMRGIGLRGTYMPHFWFGGIISLLLGGGVLALAVYGAISLVRRNKASEE